MNKFLMTLACAIITLPTFAAKQNDTTLSGKVIDKTTGEPASWATVALMTPDSTIVAGTACAEDGTYELKAPAGTYILSCALLGCGDYVTNISLASGSKKLDPIYLEADATMLGEVTISERVKLVEMKVDKVVMNISQSAFAQGSNALELMKKAPGVTIDKDGNVMLNGKAVSVWIDGRPSYMDGKTLEALLRSTNSESIDKFELMEHPSAKYDAEGQGGIINIKTKRNLAQGFNGSMGVGGGGMYFSDIKETPLQQSWWANLSYRTNKTNTFFNVYEGTYNIPIRIKNELTAPLITIPENPAATFRQNGNSMFLNKVLSYNVKLGNDWFINDRNTLGVIAYVPGNRATLNSKTSTTRQYINDTPQNVTSSDIKNGPASMLQTNLNLNYTHVFDETRAAELTANADYYHAVLKNESSQVDSVLDLSLSSSMLMIIPSKSMSSDNVYDIYSAKADYQTVIAQKFMLEAGAKWARSQTDNNSVETQPLLPDMLSDFIYTEDIAAAYASFAGQLGPKFSIKAGLRGEYTYSLGDWKSINTKTDRHYFDLFPTVYMGYQPSENWRLSASYSRRITRPDYNVLNPAKTYVDAKTYTVGDPDILPQYSNATAFQVGYGQHLAVAFAYNTAKNLIQQIPSFETDGTQIFTYGNNGKQNLGAVVLSVAALPVTDWLMWTVNATGLYISTTTLANAVKDSWGAQGYTDFTFNLPKDWKIDLDATYQSPMNVGIYHTHTQFVSNLAVKKNFSERLSLTLRLDDIFRTSNNDLEMYDEFGASTTSFQQKYYNQKFMVDLTWNFGKAQRPVRARNVGNLEEMSRVSGGGAGSVGK